MANQDTTAAASQTVLLERIGVLEEENARLSAELERFRGLEQSLRNSERIYRAIGETIPYGIWVCDPDGRTTYASQSMLDLLGITFEQFAKFGWADFLEPDDRERIPAAWKEFIKTEGLWDMEHRFRGKDGQVHTILGRGVPVRDEEGKVIAWAGINLDISNLKQVEQDLRNSQRIYRAIGESIPYGIWTCDPDGRNTYASQSLLDLLGITQEQCSEFGWGDSLHPDDAARTIAAWQECVRTEGVWDIEHRYRGTDGQVHPVLARGVPVRDEQGKIVAWAGINLDISAQKQREKQVREGEMRVELRRRLLDQREQERQALARDIHDGPIQTLAALNMELDMARTGADDPAVRRELSRIRRHLRQAMQELRDMVGELRSSLLQSMGLSRAMRLHAREFESRHPGLEVVCHLTPDRRRLSLYASLSLFRIYQEALNNVARHAQAKRVTVRLSFENDCAVLQVRDNGRGMDGTLDLMEQTSRGHYGVAGMQERVDAVNGTLVWHSRPGKGTTVTASVPLDGLNLRPGEH